MNIWSQFVANARKFWESLLYRPDQSRPSVNVSELTRTERIAYEQGREAESEGEPVDANPYRAGTRLHDCWREGWLDSEFWARAW